MATIEAITTVRGCKITEFIVGRALPEWPDSLVVTEIRMLGSDFTRYQVFYKNGKSSIVLDAVQVDYSEEDT